MSDFRIEKQIHSGISYGNETRYYHVSKKPKSDGRFDVFEIAENSDCSICHKRNTECYNFSVYCANYDNDDYDTYMAEDEVYICIECLKNAAERLKEHVEKKDKMIQKAKSLKSDIGKNTTCTMGNGDIIDGKLTKIIEKNHKIFIQKKGNKKSTGVDLMEVEDIKVK